MLKCLWTRPRWHTTSMFTTTFCSTQHMSDLSCITRPIVFTIPLRIPPQILITQTFVRNWSPKLYPVFCNFIHDMSNICKTKIPNCCKWNGNCQLFRGLGSIFVTKFVFTKWKLLGICTRMTNFLSSTLFGRDICRSYSIIWYYAVSEKSSDWITYEILVIWCKIQYWFVKL